MTDPKTQELAINSGLGNRFKLLVIERRKGHPDEGKVVQETDWQPNLILSQGMDSIASNPLCSQFTFAVIGTGTTPTVDTSGSITLTTSGTTATASTAFWASTDVGKLIVTTPGGAKATITAFTNSTTVTLSATLNVTSASQFNMYRINQTGLTAEVKRTNTYLTGTGNCGSSLSGSTFTHQRTYDFSVEVSNQNYNEIGFSSRNTAGNNLFSRAILAGAPISVLTGQQLRVIYQVLLTVGPTTANYKAAPVSGWPSLSSSVVFSHTTGFFTLVGYGLPLNTQVSFQGTTAPAGITFGTTYYVIPNDANTFAVSATPSGPPVTTTTDGSGILMFTNTNGNEVLINYSVSAVAVSTGLTASMGNDNTNATEPCCTARGLVLSTDTTALPTWPTGVGWSIFFGQTLTHDSYTSGSYTLTERTTINTTSGNSNAIHKMGSMVTVAGPVGIIFFFDNPQQKTNLFTLTIVYRWTWTWVGL